ncbi:protein of unknown function (plasmid) [Cupriavidus taiwanensis]|nr:protein of unknown function [Cupriavidus taiwanensis]
MLAQIVMSHLSQIEMTYPLPRLACWRLSVCPRLEAAMRKPETITTTMRELDRLKVIQAVVDHGLAVWRAARSSACRGARWNGWCCATARMVRVAWARVSAAVTATASCRRGWSPACAA